MKNLFIYFFTGALLISCSSESNSTKSEAVTKSSGLVQLSSEQIKNAGITYTNLEERNLATQLTLNGKINVQPSGFVSISAPLGAYLKSSKLLEGMYVKKGESLAIMEDVQYIQLQQDYLTAKSELKIAESEYQRQRELNQSKASSDKVLEQASLVFQTKQVLVKSLEQKLLLIGIQPSRLSPSSISKSVSIPSPISGYVSKVNVKMGQYVSPNDVLFELVNPNDIILSLSVFDKDLHQLQIGQKLQVYSNSNPTTTYSCEIFLIGRSLSEHNSTEVHCKFSKTDDHLVPGMFMNAKVDLKASKTQTLPEECIVRFENTFYVFVQHASNTFEMLPIEIGVTENGYTEIKNASKLQNQKVVQKGAYQLLMALKNGGEE